jgi:hypothetical protein
VSRTGEPEQPLPRQTNRSEALHPHLNWTHKLKAASLQGKDLDCLNQEEIDMMKKPCSMLLAIALSLCLTIMTQAQENPQTRGTHTPVIKQRQRHEQKRIHKGVASGELKAGETRKLENEQKEIQADKQTAKEDGSVTREERKDIAKKQVKASRHIYRAKHNDKTRP